jgi:hypothetical protein
MAGRQTAQGASLATDADGRCPVCSQLITTDTDWHTHHIVWRVKGGSDRLDNLALMHPDCHRQVHSSRLVVVCPGVVIDTFEGLEPDARETRTSGSEGRAKYSPCDA